MLDDLKMLFLIIGSLPKEMWVFIISSLIFAIVTWWGKKRHYLSVAQAHQELKRLKKIESAQQITHLRKVDPFVFEEMILTAIKRQGHSITRNKRYTGDGGIDGQCRIKGKDYLIQAKRYSNHIKPAHISDFANICQKRRSRGLFIHTGKTGPKSKRMAQKEKIEIISGDRLLKLLLNEPKI